MIVTQFIVLVLSYLISFDVADIISTSPAFVVGGGHPRNHGHPTNRARPTVQHLKQFQFSKLYLLPFLGLTLNKTFPLDPPHAFKLLHTKYHIQFAESDGFQKLLTALLSDFSLEKKINSLISFGHLTAIEIAILHEYNVSFVFEDDVNLDRSIREMLSDLWLKRPHNGCMLQLNSVIRREDTCSPRTPNEWVKGIVYGAAAYVLTLEGAKTLRPIIVEAIENGEAIDVIYSQRMSENGKGYHLRMQPDNSWSDDSKLTEVQRWRHTMRECGLASQRPIDSHREKTLQANS